MKGANRMMPVSNRRPVGQKKNSESEVTLLSSSSMSSSSPSSDGDSGRFTVGDEVDFPTDSETDPKYVDFDRRPPPRDGYESVGIVRSTGSRQPVEIDVRASVRSASTITSFEPYTRNQHLRPPSSDAPPLPCRKTSPGGGYLNRSDYLNRRPPPPPPRDRPQLPLNPRRVNVSNCADAAPDCESGSPYITPTEVIRRKRYFFLRRRFLLVLTGVSLLVGVASLLLLCLTWNDRFMRDSDQEVCVPCWKLRQKPGVKPDENPTLSGLKITARGNEDFCCAKTTSSVQMSTFVELLISDPDSHYTSHLGSNVPEFTSRDFKNQTYVFTPVHAHKGLYYDKDTKVEGGAISLNINNKATADGIEHKTGVHSNSDKVTIEYPGFYFVYSSLEILLHKPCVNRQTWKHYIKQIVDKTSGRRILSMAMTRCCDNCSLESTSSYTGGIFWLDEGDRLWVEVSAIDGMEIRKGGSFLGLAMMGTTR